MKGGQPTDEALIRQVAGGDKEALAALYDRYAKLVFSLALRLAQDQREAEEITQEVFVSLWQRAGTYQSARGRFSSWLLGIAHHRAVDELRRRGRRPATLPLSEEREVPSSLAVEGPEVPDDHHERSARRALDRLPQEQRQAIALAYFGGLTQAEIARTLNTPLGTVKTRIRLGLKKMREMMESWGLESSGL
ncbi:MAG: sigma-70 family RNA polymerase sigma factor [Chloroflexi bacterium]|nr:sigma-70 family RNA polymerase sigma factor [Chloroflexota bacterium]